MKRYIIVILLGLLCNSCDSVILESPHKTAYDAQEYFLEHASWTIYGGFANADDLEYVNMGTGRVLITEGVWRNCNDPLCDNIYFYNGYGHDIKQRLQDAGHSTQEPIHFILGSVGANGYICNDDVLLVIAIRSLKHSQVVNMFRAFCKADSTQHRYMVQ